MRKYMFYLIMALAVIVFGDCSPDEIKSPEYRG